MPVTSNDHFLLRNRAMRNELLKKTDYYMLTDVYETLSDIQKQDIKDYRQSLREFINTNRDKYLIDGVKFVEFPKPPEWMGEIRMPKY